MNTTVVPVVVHSLESESWAHSNEPQECMLVTTMAKALSTTRSARAHLINKVFALLYFVDPLFFYAHTSIYSVDVRGVCVCVCMCACVHMHVVYCLYTFGSHVHTCVGSARSYYTTSSAASIPFLKV